LKNLEMTPTIASIVGSARSLGCGLLKKPLAYGLGEASNPLVHQVKSSSLKLFLAAAGLGWQGQF
jgi:hypothetical protein